MTAQVLAVNKTHPEPEYIRLAAHILNQGGLVAFPTETVYGLGALAERAESVDKIYAAKSRPKNNPLIVHVASVEMAKAYCRYFPVEAELLAESFWPGPLTMIVPKNDRIPLAVTAGRDNVGLRFPAHPVARALIESLRAPIAAPSANLYTAISPTLAAHVVKNLGERIDLILDAGPADYGLESTVIDLSGHTPTIMRPGSIDADQIRRVIGHVSVFVEHQGEQEAHISPGLSRKHYAPKAKVALITYGDQGLLYDRAMRVLSTQSRVGLLVHRCVGLHKEGVMTRQLPSEPMSYAQYLYHALHALEDAGCDYILIEDVPEDEAWRAVADRIRRAAG